MATRTTQEPSLVEIPPEYSAHPVVGLSKKKDKNVFQIKKVRTIVLDAGHGGKDPGAIGRSGVKEKIVALDITKRLKKALERKGFKIVMTRNKDVFISLKKRTEIASHLNADLFVSIHANANRVRSVHGMEVYTLRHLNILEKNEAQRKNNHKHFFKALVMKENERDVEKILEEKLYNHKQDAAHSLAKKVVKETSRFIKAKNLGVKQSRFFVLRNTLIPAILVEVGFLSNPREERLLKSSSYRQKIANGLAKSIVNYAQGQ